MDGGVRPTLLEGVDVTIRQFKETVEANGFFCRFDETERSWGSIKAKGTLLCASKYERGYTGSLVWIQRGTTHWYVKPLSFQVFRIKNPARLLDFVIGILSGRISFDSRDGLRPAVMKKYRFIDVTDRIYLSVNRQLDDDFLGEQLGILRRRLKSVRTEQAGIALKKQIKFIKKQRQ